MRVLQVCNAFPPAVGGCETHNFSVVKYLVERGHSVEVVVVQPSQEVMRRRSYAPETMQALLSPRYTLPELPGVVIHNIFPRPLWFYYDLVKKVHELERVGKFDVMDLHIYLYALPFSGKRRMLLSLHFDEMTCPRTDPPLPCEEKATFSRCRECVSTLRYLYWSATRRLALKKVSRLMVKFERRRQLMGEAGIEESKVALIPHWIDVERFHSPSPQGPSRADLGLSPTATVFAFLGRLNPANGLDLLLAAFRQLVQVRPDTALLLVGGGELKAELEGECRRNGLEDRVKFLGAVPHALVPATLSLADIHVLPQSNYVNYNWSLLEMMATERAIIATNMGATGDILEDGYSALLAEPTPESLAARMIEVVDNPELRYRLARSALNTVRERHSLDNLLKYEGLLAEIAGSER